METQEKHPFVVESDYTHDVFISYKKDDFAQEWLKNDFFENLEFRLGTRLGRKPIIFIDYSLREGDNWYEKILKALFHSKSIVSIISPGYADSRWCSAEWKTFEKRNHCISLRCESSGKYVAPVNKIIPIRWQDCEDSPLISGVHAAIPYNFEPYRHRGSAWRNLPKYVEFEDSVERVALHLQELIAAVEPFDTTWPWVDPQSCPPLVSPPANIDPKL